MDAKGWIEWGLPRRPYPTDWRDAEIDRLTAELDRERTARLAAESRLAAFDPVTEAQQRAAQPSGGGHVHRDR